MKIVVCILSIYFLGLNFVPCNDTLPIVDQSQTEMTSIDQGSDNHHDHTDDCTPFCQCHCCHIHVVQLQNHPIEATLSQELKQKTFFHHDRFSDDILNSLFQPPQV